MQHSTKNGMDCNSLSFSFTKNTISLRGMLTMLAICHEKSGLIKHLNKLLDYSIWKKECIFSHPTIPEAVEEKSKLFACIKMTKHSKTFFEVKFLKKCVKKNTDFL